MQDTRCTLRSRSLKALLRRLFMLPPRLWLLEGEFVKAGRPCSLLLRGGIRGAVGELSVPAKLSAFEGNTAALAAILGATSISPLCAGSPEAARSAILELHGEAQAPLAAALPESAALQRISAQR